MCYINKENFSILTSVADDFADYYFECDDLIAPAIALLNRKGYRTTFCCSGHPFLFMIESVYNQEEMDQSYDPNLLKITIVSKNEVDQLVEENGPEYADVVYRTVSMSDSYLGMYVAFEKNHEFPTLPEDFILDDGIIREYRGLERITEDFDGVEFTYRVNKVFYDWVKTLPDLN